MKVDKEYYLACCRNDVENVSDYFVDEEGGKCYYLGEHIGRIELESEMKIDVLNIVVRYAPIQGVDYINITL